GADRLLDLADRRVAHFLPGGEALAQGGEGPVAVAVVGVLGEHRLDQLGDWVAMRLVERQPVHLPQSFADRADAGFVGAPPGHGADPSPVVWFTGWRSRSKRASCRLMESASSTGGCRERERRPSTAMETRPTARNGCPSWNAVAPLWQSTCRAGAAR